MEHLFHHWFWYSLCGIFLFGTLKVFNKIPSRDPLVIPEVMASWQALGRMIAALIFFAAFLVSISSGGFVVAIFRGAISFAMLLFTMYAHKHVPVNTLLPMSAMLTTISAFLIGLFAFGDRLSPVQIIGIALLMIVIYLFTRKDNQEEVLNKTTLMYIGGLVLLQVANSVIIKLGADTGDIKSFLLWQSIFTFGVGLIPFFIKFIKEDFKTLSQKVLNKKAMGFGLLSGIMSFFGNWLVLISLTIGPYSGDQTIQTMDILVTSTLAWLFFDEKLTTKKVILIACAVGAIILVKVGGR
jgi:drug/metabolite transporter (DMT)-like permease